MKPGFTGQEKYGEGEKHDGVYGHLWLSLELGH